VFNAIIETVIGEDTIIHHFVGFISKFDNMFIDIAFEFFIKEFMSKFFGFGKSDSFQVK